MARSIENWKKKRSVIVVLPAGRGTTIRRIAQRRWLSRGAVSFTEPSIETLHRVLALLGHEFLPEALAGLRFWGQTGERSSAWMTGADPVHLETMLNDLRLHALTSDEIEVAELRALFRDLQESIGGDGENGEYAFARLGECGYLRGRENLATAAVSIEIANGSVADKFMPSGAGSESYHRLLSELQMSLHDHPVNERRTAAGQRVINSLWIWGGGIAPEKDVRPIPPLFSDDPLFNGYWESCTGVTEGWSGNIERCFDIAVGGFVVVLPKVDDDNHTGALEEFLEQLMRVQKSGRISELTVLFRDGISVTLNRYDYLKFWRRSSALLSENTGHA